MSVPVAQPQRWVRPSVSRRDLIPELGIAAGTVGVTTVVHWVIALRLGDNSPLFLFAATAAALTFWRGLGPGMLASSLGSAVGPSLQPLSEFAGHRSNVPLETLLLCAGSLFTCWLIYRLRVDQEDAQVIHSRRTDALAFVSHELRNPLFNIQLAAELLERERDRSAETRGAAKLILQSAARLGRVIDDLDDVSRLQASAIRITPTLLRLQHTILAAVEAAGPAIELRHQHLEIDVPLDPPLWINGDDVRLQQVFSNVLLNACKYSPRCADIVISAREENGRAVIVVRDTGVGIRPEMLEHIFDPFVREADAAADGIGIGLTLVRNLVMQHGGQITAHSEGLGLGSTFRIELPLVAGRQ
jgi:signal transduction histidine kinase